MSGELIPADEHSELAPIEVAKDLIARAVWEHDADALVELRSRASAFELYHRRAGARELANDAGEIKVRAERGLGAIDALENPRGRPEKGITSDTFSLQVRANTRAIWRKLGTITDATFDDYVEQIRTDENQAVSTAAVVGIARLGGTLSSTTFECYTPAEYIEAARETLGAIDLDPASSVEANETVKAAEIYTLEDDGLGREWYGRVWLNPPYGRSNHAAFATKLVGELDAGRVSQAIILLNAYGFDAAWFQPLWAGLLCFTDHRIKFYGGGPTFGSLFVYLGKASPGRVRSPFSSIRNRCASRPLRRMSGERWRGSMTASRSKIYAERLVLPAMLPLIGIDGQVEAVETRNEQIAKTLDIVGGIDFWVRTGDGRLIPLASRNQWHYADGVNRDSFTVRLDVGGNRTEAHKRVLAIKEGGILPEWTIQGYITEEHELHHAGAIPTRDLFDAFLEAIHHPKFTTKTNPADGHVFWAGYWGTLRRYGHGDRLVTYALSLF